ncbi:extensin-like isoform X1 [Pararge aegeria]|uniref:extensin-like isoform X1 n=1 Tax=Pararge aegeria TaxID=116150 RepID=UPI0019D180F7|nr:extensin-like isoform X1 [Pararge aegeria]XP_039759810.1 extensin-like isoform X1 [Pararge aegeria]
MSANGYGPAPAGHVRRIPNYGRTQVNPMGGVEPPACIQNAMMTKDKKPFTYTPGGLDLSQIKTPSMARRMARQRSQEEHEQAYAQQQPNNNYHSHGPGGPVPPPPPPMKIPAPPPPPPLVIQAPDSKSPKTVQGERPEIVIPDNPIGMLRKTNSPYHWEAEKAELQRMGHVPKFTERAPGPLTVQLPAQNSPQNYSPQNNIQRQNYPYGNQNQSPDSPIHRPEAQYAHQKTASPNTNGPPHTRELLVRQDSQFNKSPQPFANQSPSTGSPYSPSANNHWKQPDKRDSPVYSTNSPQSPQTNRGPFSPAVKQNVPSYNQPAPATPNNTVFHTLPRAGPRNQENFQNNYNSSTPNNVKESQQSPNTEASTAPWRTSTLNRHPRENQQMTYHNTNANQQQPQRPAQEANNNQTENNYSPPWKQENKSIPSQVGNQQQYTPPWRQPESTGRSVAPTTPPETRYQSSISIPVSPKKQTTQPNYNNSPPQKEAVYVSQEPVYYCPDSPKTIPPWVKTQKEKTKTPPPVWCQRPLEGKESAQRDLYTPPRETTNQEPEWIRKSNEMQRGNREYISPPKYQQQAQPNWSTLPSENRRSVPRDGNQGRIIPIQMEVSSTDTRNQGGNQPQLRIVIDMKQNPNTQNGNTQAPYSQPTQRIMRVLSPQLVRIDDNQNQPDLPTLNTRYQNIQDSQPKTRIIPIQIEGSGNEGANKRVIYHKISQEGVPRQSKAFKVLQVITGTQEMK